MATTTQDNLMALKIAPSDLPRGVTEAQIKAHVVSPAHVRGPRIEVVDPARERRLDLKVRPRTFATTPRANLEAFGLAIHTALQASVTGYVLQVRSRGTLVHTAIWNWSRTPSDGGQGWNEDRRMHVASVSKLFTAVGMVKALDSEGISVDAPIRDFLPSYWGQGAKVGQITFRHLLTHRSGFVGDPSASDYVTMKNRVASGVTATPGSTKNYQNANFGLCRILIPIVTGMIDRGAGFPAFARDLIWDALTINHYRNYMQTHVFTPAGVSNAGFAPPAGGALAYRHPHDNEKGWNSGDLATMAGGAGWRLSCKEVLNVLDHVRRRGTIMTPQRAQALLDGGFGIDETIETPAGKTYNKNGAWINNARTEQCVAFFLPAAMEAALFVNSPIGQGDFSLRGLVQDAYVGCLSA